MMTYCCVLGLTEASAFVAHTIDKRSLWNQRHNFTPCTPHQVGTGSVCDMRWNQAKAPINPY